MKRTEFDERQKAYEADIAYRRVDVRQRCEMRFGNPAFMGGIAARESAIRQTAEAIEAEIERQMAYEIEKAAYSAFGAGGREAAIAQVKANKEPIIIIF